jgi:O-antigen/teichoic acid export membrane protein
LGIVRKQSIQSSIILLTGAVLGFVNKGPLFTNFMSEEEVGLANLLLTTAIMFAQFSSMGFVNVSLKYFPYFKDKQRDHHGFLAWILSIPLLGFLFITLHFLLFKPWIVHLYEEKSPLFVHYYYYILPLAFFSLYFNLFEIYLQSLLKSVISVFLREVVQRILIAVCILLFAAGWLNLDQFVLLYVALLSSTTLVLVGYAVWLGQVSLRWPRSWRFRRLWPRMLNFGLFSFVSNISAILAYNLDSLMLAEIVGLAAVGIYTTGYYISAMILIPWRAISRITGPLVAEHWKNGDMVAMDRLYKRTALINTLLGIFLFVLLMANLHNLERIMPASYANFWIILVCGITRVVEMVTGLNGYILQVSRYYKWDTIFNTGGIVVMFLMNLWLIPVYGALGAAISVGTFLCASNLFRVGFVWYKLKIHPFTMNGLLLTLLGIGVFLLQLLLPDLGNLWTDGSVRTLLMTLVFALTAYFFHLVPDANQFLGLAINKLRRR